MGKIVSSHRLTPEGNSIKDIVKEFNSFCDLFFPSLKPSKRVFLALDVFLAYIADGAWINNYFLYGFIHKNRRERKEYVTWKRAVCFTVNVNGGIPHPVLRNKNEFNEAFSQHIKRDWIFTKNATEQEFVDFCTKHRVFMEKPQDERNGIGVTKVVLNNDADLHKLYRDYAGKAIVLEEIVTNCKVLRDLHPTSLNTIRVLTLLNKDKTQVTILGADLRMGMSGNVLDNANRGGLFSAIDISVRNGGRLTSKAMNYYNGEKYEFHPDTKVKIIGLQIPNEVWRNVVVLCKQAAMDYKAASLIGWDVAVSFDESTQNYVIQLIEGNDNPDFPLHQMSTGKGLVGKIKEAGYSIKNNIWITGV